MIRKGAAKTETVAALAMYGWDNVLEVALSYWTVYGVFAIRRGTPFEIFLVVNVGSVKKDVITTCGISNYILKRLSEIPTDL